MKKRTRSGFICVLVLVLFAAFALWLGGLAGGPAALVHALQTSAPTAAPAASPTVSPVFVVQTFFGAIQAGDFTTLSAVTGGSGTIPGISNWGSIDLIAFPANTVFGPLSYQVLGQSATGANVRVTGTFVFKDPGGPPGQGSRDAYRIDGEAVLVAKGNTWVLTGLPNYDWIIPFRSVGIPQRSGDALQRELNAVSSFMGL
jgi:hypothetical protein